MRSDTAHSPRVFNYSLDWRFLLPTTGLHQGRILFEEEADFTETLEQIGIHPMQRLSFSDLKNLKEVHFPFFALPFGLHADWIDGSAEERVKLYSALRRLLDADGYLLVGFNNALNSSTHSLPSYYSSTPHRTTAELHQAGFKWVKIFGAMPSLRIPEYIFDLDPQTIQFAMQNRFRRKPVLLQVLRVLSGTVGIKRIVNFLPCYFAVATV